LNLLKISSIYGLINNKNTIAIFKRVQSEQVLLMIDLGTPRHLLQWYVIIAKLILLKYFKKVESSVYVVGRR
jgi:hypothetical protein